MLPWIVLGSGPTASFTYSIVRGEFPHSPVITTNRGILIEYTPTMYFLSDTVACEKFSKLARVAQSRGTECITLQRSPAVIQQRGISWFDTFIREGTPYEPFQMSGLWCVEHVVLERGAQHVIMCGFDGYDGKNDYATDSTCEKNGDLTKRVIEPLTESICRKYPGTLFECREKPRYEITADNWLIL